MTPGFQLIRLPLALGANPEERPPNNLLTNAQPAAWVGNHLRLELGFCQADAETLHTDISNIASVKVEVRASLGDPDSVVILMSETVASSAFNGAVTQSQWDAGTHQHLVADFSALETDLDLGGEPRKDFWLAISYTTTDSPGHCITAYAGNLRFLQDGTTCGAEGPVQGNNIIPGGATYDVNGDYQLTGQTDCKMYRWEKGANDTDITSGATTLTATGTFTSQGTTFDLTGTPSAAVTAVIRADITLTAEEMDGRFLRGPIADWDNAEAYCIHALVTHNGRVFTAKRANTGVTPPTPPATNDDWHLILEKGADGTNGDDAYLYIAYADSASGTGFTTTSDANKDYIAFKATTAPIASPQASDFTGLWKLYKGADGSGGLPTGVTVEATTTRGAVPADLTKAVEFSGSAPSVYEIPALFANQGKGLIIVQAGAGAVTVQAESGHAVAILGDAATQRKGDVLLLYHTDTADTWRGTLIRRNHHTHTTSVASAATTINLEPGFAAQSYDLTVTATGTVNVDVLLKFAGTVDSGLKPSKGDMAFFTVTMPAEPAVAVRFYNDTTSGTLIRTIQGHAELAGQYAVAFRYSGAAWLLQSIAPIASTWHAVIYYQAGGMEPRATKGSAKSSVTINGFEFTTQLFADGNEEFARGHTITPSNFVPGTIKVSLDWAAPAATSGLAKSYVYLKQITKTTNLSTETAPPSSPASPGVTTNAQFVNANYIDRTDSTFDASAWTGGRHILYFEVGRDGDEAGDTLGQPWHLVGMELKLPVADIPIV